jgi:hypothetical protein
MFNEYDTFVLVKPLADVTIPVGSRGTVLMVFPGVANAYEVEFPDSKGGNLGKSITYTITEDYMSPANGP